MSWHAEPDQLRRYLADEVDDVLAWSLEAHLDSCPACRVRLAELSAGSPVATIVQEVQQSLVLEEQVTRGRLRSVRRVAGPAWRLSWVIGSLLLLAIAIALDASATGASQPALLSVAPALPLIGVAVSFGGHFDPMYEMTAATPSAGLRLVLWRTAGILGVTIPLATVVGLIGGNHPVAWLLPCLALTVVTLASGTVVPLNPAAAVIGSVWVLAVAIPAGAGTDLSAAASNPLWIALIAAAAALLAFRRDAYNRLENA